MIRQSVATELQKVSNFISKTPKEEDSKKVLTRKEVSKFLDVSLTTLYNWNNDGILVNHKTGGRVHYKESDVMALFDNSKTLN